MANHIRRQIREAVAGAVTGLTTTGTRVFQQRVYPLETTDLPGLLVSTPREQSVGTSLGAPRVMERRVRLHVTALARATADVEDVLDQICKEVEVALAMPCAALAGIAKIISLTDTDITVTGDGDRPVGQAALTYEVLYMTAENAPDVAL